MAELTDDAHQDIMAALEGLLERVAATYVDDPEMNAPSRICSAYGHLVEKLFGIAGLQMMTMMGDESGANVALNLLVIQAMQMGDAMHSMDPVSRMASILRVGQTLGAVAARGMPE